jgi:hypothetical protein
LAINHWPLTIVRLGRIDSINGSFMEMVNGEWSMENGQWKMVNGKWSMENGQWKWSIVNE